MNPTSTSASRLISAGLIAAGAVTCATLGRSTVTDPDLKAPLNPFGINTSPYGEVLAMAMQGQVETLWNGTSASSETSPPPPTANLPLRDRFRLFLDEMEAASIDRTNPTPPSNAQRRHIRRTIENKLRFGYQLDPAHYGNYNSYHLFLTEPALGTRPELTPGAAKLADQTIRYCLSRTDDPLPALTAAAAAENILQLMFTDHAKPDPQFTTAQMRQYLDLLDHSIARYRQLSDHWKATGNWELLSDARRLEYEDRLSFVLKIRDVSEKTIQRLEAKTTLPQ